VRTNNTRESEKLKRNPRYRRKKLIAGGSRKEKTPLLKWFHMVGSQGRCATTIGA
jgi:hypothetical protein